MAVIVAMIMAMAVRGDHRVRGYERHMPVAHAALRDDMIGKRLHLGTASLEHGHFETTVVTDVNVERRLGEVVVIVEFLRQTFG